MEDQKNSSFDNWLSSIKQLLLLLLLTIMIFLIIINLCSVNNFVKRFLERADKVSIAELTVSISEKKSENAPIITRQEKWAAFYRVADNVEISEASLQDEITHVEYLDITALAPLNLGGAYIGDEKQMLLLDEADFLVQVGETVRIYTYDINRDKLENGKKIINERLNRRAVYARPFEKEGGDTNNSESCEKKKKDVCEKTGIFKADVGEGDRIVLINRDKKVILDLDYWWVEPPVNKTLTSMKRK